MEQMTSLLETSIGWATLYSVKLIVALLIFFVGRLVARKMRVVVQKLMVAREVDEGLVKFGASLVYYALLAFVVIAALGQVGIQTASFVAIVGAAGLAVGLAMQGSLSNFAAGVLIILFKPFRIGDFVEVADTSGVVESIMIFTTELKTGDNKKVIVPNSSVLSGVITNYSANDTRRVDLVMGIGYDDDIDKAKAVLAELMAADERILNDPAPAVAMIELADSSVNFNVRPWVKTADYWGVYSDLTEAIKKRFDQEDISIPYPQRDVHVHQIQS
ncbi:MAG: mechanosensitive ion channel family protein [Gammaproteobacteria bacterium]|nr:MAG: mechanosensitive ion channel family protein [Gammaproteobacteria bacterium]RLA51053.1 MAG: mechanosensitive ion channel family protein [Gammaproteobacteria bacterium]